MARYFTILQGLRGCYMPDNASVIRCDTRRELKSAIEYDARDIREAGYQGIDKKTVAWAAAKAWRDAAPRAQGNGAILPYGDRERGRPYALEVSPATRSDYLEYVNQ